MIDQYQVSTDKRNDVTNDPNRSDDPTYILRLIGQVVMVSLDTVKIVASLPPLGLRISGGGECSRVCSGPCSSRKAFAFALCLIWSGHPWKLIRTRPGSPLT